MSFENKLKIAKLFLVKTVLTPLAWVQMDKKHFWTPFPPISKSAKNWPFEKTRVICICTFQLHMGSSVDFKGPQTVVLHCRFIFETPYICERSLHKTKRTVTLKIEEGVGCKLVKLTWNGSKIILLDVLEIT